MKATEAATLCIVLESWLRRQEKDGRGLPNAEVRQAAEELALAAPETARHCDRLKVLLPAATRAALASVDSEVTTNKPDWMTAEQAGTVLGIQPDSVRWLLRKGLLNGRKTERGWRVNAQSVTRYRRNRAA